MFSLTILASGSSGNCAVVQTDSCKVLVDCGLSARQINVRLHDLNIDPASLDGILLTHEHIDHVKGLRVLCKQHDLPVYCNSLTAEAIRHQEGRDLKNWRLFSTGSRFSIQDLEIETFSIPHDAAEPVGFVLHNHNSALGFCTDLGFATKLVMERIRGVHTLLIETNHDEKLLQNDTRRPWSVKQRILSRHGHLSNDSAASILLELLDHNLRRAVLGHLSRDCNSPDLALQTVQTHLRRHTAHGIELHCASPTQPSPSFPIEP